MTFLFYFYSGPVENIIRVHCFLDGKYNNKTLYRVDPRTERVWNASVHLHAEFFQISVTELHDLQLVESTDAEPRIRRADCKVTRRFLTARKVGFPTSPVCAVQGSTVNFFFWRKKQKASETIISDPTEEDSSRQEKCLIVFLFSSFVFFKQTSFFRAILGPQKNQEEGRDFLCTLCPHTCFSSTNICYKWWTDTDTSFSLRGHSLL